MPSIFCILYPPDPGLFLAFLLLIASPRTCCIHHAMPCWLLCINLWTFEPLNRKTFHIGYQLERVEEWIHSHRSEKLSSQENFITVILFPSYQIYRKYTLETVIFQVTQTKILFIEDYCPHFLRHIWCLNGIALTAGRQVVGRGRVGYGIVSSLPGLGFYVPQLAHVTLSDKAEPLASYTRKLSLQEPQQHNVQSHSTAQPNFYRNHVYGVLQHLWHSLYASISTLCVL